MDSLNQDVVRIKSNRLLTVVEVAQQLGLPTSTIYDAVRQKRIGGVVRIGRAIRFVPEKLEAWINEGGQPLKDDQNIVT